MKILKSLILILITCYNLNAQDYQINDGKFIANHSGTGWKKGLDVLRDGSLIARFEIDPSNTLMVGSMINTGLTLRTNATNRFHISSNGLVGIGTISPESNMHLIGSSGFKWEYSENSNQAKFLLGYGSSTANPALKFYRWTGTNATFYPAHIEMSQTGGVGHLDFNVGSYSELGSESLTTAMSIFQGGNIGIGTFTTGSHKLAVEGSIGAREIKVEASGWSDFVFENDYNLRTLEEVEEHIVEKGHLPEIPNEAEVTENGINLGEMDAKLLQKIEELTLYLIEQNKQNQAQQAKIEQLEKELNALKND
ncbi:tail fiber protein [Zunongwangia pacifica]|uniref:Tail fiber protein n=1 Tax=Zunongwangia pacifica TaxID=2911062 RepID=A0A9X2A1L0_9FLAO|nr:tail fiber protein [Zunongwangia pacifica]MCL6218464.1 tail fiber protein [Zunongwangia pacifica]